MNNPGTARMLGHVAVKDTPSIMRDDKEAVKHAERQRGHSKEIHRSDGLSMIAQKGRPSLCRFWIPRRFPHPAHHGPFRREPRLDTGLIVMIQQQIAILASDRRDQVAHVPTRICLGQGAIDEAH